MPSVTLSGGFTYTPVIVPITGAAQLGVLVDWNADGDFADANEDVSARVDDGVGIVWSRGKDQIRQFAPAAAAQAGFMLNNLSQDYSPGNGSSPIAGQVLPGRKVRIQTAGMTGEDFLFVDGTDYFFVDGSDWLFSTTAPARIIWTGLIDDIDQHPEREARSTSFSCLGALSRLRGKTISTALYQNILTSDALGHLLDEAGWPSTDRIIQTGLTTLTWWWLDNQDAFDAAMQLMATEGPGASMYEDSSGNIVFENRDARTTQVRSTVSQATFADTTIPVITAIDYSPNYKDAIQAATLTVNERAAEGQSVIWELGSTLTLAPFEIRRFQVRSNSGDPFMNVMFPSAAPGDTVQTLAPNATLTSGTFKLRFKSQTTSALNWNDTAATIQTALTGLSTIGASNVACTGGPINISSVAVRFTGTFAGQGVNDLIEVVDSTLNPVSGAPAVIAVTEEFKGDGNASEIQALRPSTTLTSGSFSIVLPIFPYTTSSIAYNASAATIQAAINAGPGPYWPSVTCTGGPINTTPVICNMIYAGDLPEMTISPSAVFGDVPSATIDVSITTQGGIPDYITTAGVAGFELSRTSGSVITLAVGADIDGATVTGLRLRGNLVPVVRSHQVSFPEDTTDIPSGRIARPNARTEISLTFAQQYVSMFVSHYKTARPTVTFTVTTSLNYAGNDALYQREISDLITIINAQLGISEDYHIEQIRQSVTNMLLFTQFGCEKAVGAGDLQWYA